MESTSSNLASHTRANRLTGAIRKLKGNKGYGFIAGDDGTDYFFHWSAMRRDSKGYRELQIQDRVEFSPLVIKDKGPRAVEILVSDPSELDLRITEPETLDQIARA
jgi:CspA family cold shock protein